MSLSQTLEEFAKWLDETVNSNPFGVEPYAEKGTVHKILVNEPRKIVTVVFNDGKGGTTSRVVKCADGDEFSPVIGVALALAEERFGSKTAFKKYIERNAKVIHKETKKGEK